MLQLLEVVTVILVSVGMALSLAHALELPGKLRLPRETYLAVQKIYYPGFTIGGLFGEFGAMMATLVLLVIAPSWLTFIALLALLVMHAVYWTVTHPVNRVWLHEQDMHAAGTAFFGTAGAGVAEGDWMRLRDRWEYSHVARAAFAMLSLVALVLAVMGRH
jgi:hypothetical protein